MTAQTRTPRAGSIAAWVLASRPTTLTAGAIPVVVGTAAAISVGRFAFGPALAALTGALLIQISTNLTNDAYDYESGVDTKHRLGPVRAVQAGLLTLRQVRTGVLVTFAAAAVAGLYLIAVAGWPIAAVGLVSLLAGFAYSAGPYPLGYHGLGDLFVMVFFGFVAVCGTAYVQTGTIPDIAWWASLPTGALATAILAVNNLRDMRTDAANGKMTLAVRLGRGGTIVEYVSLIFIAYTVPVSLFTFGDIGNFVILPLASAPLALSLVRGIPRARGRALNVLLADTAKLHFLFGILFAAGIAL